MAETGREGERGVFDELNPPYATIVADPPWPYQVLGRDGKSRRIGGGGGDNPRAPRYVVDGRVLSSGAHADSRDLSYSTMTLDDIYSLPVADLAAEDARLYLWTTNRHLFAAPDVLRSWGFEPQGRVFVWCKPPRGTMNITTEFFLVGSRGRPSALPWCGTTWFDWPIRGLRHSQKPPAFMDLVEAWSPGPYVELFARAPRLGWDSWGKGYEIGVTA